MIVFVAFVGLVGLTIAQDRSLFQRKDPADWWLDGLGLLLQGVGIPVLQATIGYQLYRYLLPNWQASLVLSPGLAFLLSFVAIDYLYYWNHRGLHGSRLWRWHQVHHTVTKLDVLGTSRNAVWTSFAIVYLWLHALFAYLLQDPTAYLLGASLTAALDLWRHSRFQPSGWWHKALSPWLILPQDHAWHHASDVPNCNYGANLKLWDRLHGTEYRSDRPPASLGIATSLTLRQKLFPLP
jgi:sterol desaturase/sphingolipid hydroxylase (fatty acid hydroxylase superfamily)